MSPKNMIRHELIGLEAEVIESTNKIQTGIRGMVVDETKNTLTIETSNGLKRIQKKGATFMFTIPGGKKVSVSGNKIAVRPEERIKLKVKKW